MPSALRADLRARSRQPPARISTTPDAGIEICSLGFSGKQVGINFFRDSVVFVHHAIREFYFKNRDLPIISHGPDHRRIDWNSVHAGGYEKVFARKYRFGLSDFAYGILEG